jgi:hypothetical protein
VREAREFADALRRGGGALAGPDANAGGSEAAPADGDGGSVIVVDSDTDPES